MILTYNTLLATYVLETVAYHTFQLFQQVTDCVRMELNITRSGLVIKPWRGKIKFLQRTVIGLYLGLYKEENISLPGGKIVGPPYWQIKRINPFFILNPLSYHKIMKIQIPPSSRILNCTHNITPGLKRKRGRGKKTAQAFSPRRSWLKCSLFWISFSSF